MNFKKLQKIFTLFIFILLGSLSFNTPIAKACSCFANNNSAVSAFYGSDAVFSGRVTDIYIPNIAELNAYAPTKITFEVFNSYKGVEKNIVVIESPTSNTACGYYFSKGKNYLVYAQQKENGNLITTSCHRTTQLEGTENDIELFNSGLKINFLLFLENPTRGPLVIALIIALIIYALYYKFKRH